MVLSYRIHLVRNDLRNVMSIAYCLFAAHLFFAVPSGKTRTYLVISITEQAVVRHSLCVKVSWLDVFLCISLILSVLGYCLLISDFVSPLRKWSLKSTFSIPCSKEPYQIYQLLRMKQPWPKKKKKTFFPDIFNHNKKNHQLNPHN